MVPASTQPRQLSSVIRVLPPVPQGEEQQRDRPAVLPLPQVMRNLSEIQQHVLARVAVHAWTHNGDIPFVAPNPHQFLVAMGLSAPGIHLLKVVVSPSSLQQSFKLTRLGRSVVRRLFRLMSADDDQRRELEFTKMRRLMQHVWESHE